MEISSYRQVDSLYILVVHVYLLIFSGILLKLFVFACCVF
jgi:hypothetical protein